MSAAATTELAIPSSRIAGVVDRAIDIAAKLTRPVFLDVENVPSRGPFMLVGNHQLRDSDPRRRLLPRAVDAVREVVPV